METEAIATVSTGPPLGAPPEPAQHNGGIAVTELRGAPPPAPEPRGTGAAGVDSTTSASSIMEVDAQASPALVRIAPSLNPPTAPTSTTNTPASLDVFADTDASANPSVSRHYGEDGDAVMTDEATSAPSRPFVSQLRQAAGNDTAKANAAISPAKPSSNMRTKRTPPQAPAKPPQQMAKGRQAAAGKRGSATTKLRPAPVWSQQGTAALRASLGRPRTRQMVPRHTYDGEQSQGEELTLAEHYMCAKKPAHLRLDGEQRAMTQLEEKTLFLWMNHEVHLAQPPLFLKETHTSKEQDAFADFHENHLGFRLYGILPAGCSISEENAKYHFCFTALQSSTNDPAAQRALERMLAAARVITCESKSRIVVLRFVRPEVRDSWRDHTFPFGNGTITLEATDSLTTAVPKIGLDAKAIELLYHVFVRGPRGYRHGEMRKIVATAAAVPVFAVELIESIGLADFSSPMWKCTFNRITCPKSLEHVRRLSVQYGDNTEIFAVHHPRASHRAPCAKCLSVRHVTNGCKNAHVAEGLARHTANIAVTPPDLPPKLTAAVSPKKLAAQLHNLRERAAPDVGKRLNDEKAARLAKTELNAKRRAGRAARDAAALVRAEQATKLQTAADRASSQAKLSKAAFLAMTKQLKTLQLRAQRNQEGVRDVSPGATSPSTPPLSHSADDMSDSELSTLSHQGDGQNASPDSKQQEEMQKQRQAPSTKDDELTIDSPKAEEEADASVPAINPAATSAVLAVNESNSHSTVTSGTVEPSSTLTVATPTVLAIDRTPATPSQQSGLVLLGPVEDIDDEQGGDGATMQTTGKRSSPPTPTSSDDERNSYSKSHRTRHPFDANESPIPVVDYLSELISAAIASKAESTRVLAIESAPAVAAAPLVGFDNQQPTVTVETRALRQLPLSTFYAPQSLAAAQAQLEQETASRMARPVSHWLSSFPSPALDALLDDLRSPLTIAAWLLALHAHEIKAPANGGCLFYALHLCRTSWELRGQSITTKSKSKYTKHTHEANSYKTRVCKLLLEYLEQVLSDGTVTIADFINRFYPTGDRPVGRVGSLVAIRAIITDIQKANVGKGLKPTHWGGDAELFATGWYTREPIFIITEGAEERTSVRVIWMERSYPDGPEKIVQLFPDADEAFELIRCCLRYRFLPTVLIHVTVNGQGHFNSFRFDDKLYTEWTADDDTGVMKWFRRDTPAPKSDGCAGVAGVSCDGKRARRSQTD